MLLLFFPCGWPVKLILHKCTESALGKPALLKRVQKTGHCCIWVTIFVSL